MALPYLLSQTCLKMMQNTYQPTGTALRIGYGGLLEQVPSLLIPISFGLQQGKCLVDILVSPAKLEAFGEQIPRFTNVSLFYLQVCPPMPRCYMLLVSHRSCIKQFSRSSHISQSVLQDSPALFQDEQNLLYVSSKCIKSIK